MTWLVVLFILVAGAPFVVESQRRRMGNAARHAAPGEFATLSQGKTHYKWYGPETGPVILCVHGLTTPSFVWSSIATALAEDGYRVLTYDLYGRGFSDRPAGPQDSAFFLRQIGDLLRDQNVTEPVTLIGYSMGGSISTALAEERPHKVKRVVLIAPGGVKVNGMDLLQTLIAMPFVGLWTILGVYPFLLKHGVRAEANDRSSVPNIEAMQLAELNWQGFLPSVRASLRDLLARNQEALHKNLNAHDMPVLAIWGEKDTLIPLEARDILMQWNPEVMHSTIAGAGHGVTYTDTDQVLDVLRPWLAAN
ncbi:MAG: alpha/beta hydrolase [Pseudomonadota bacterium]